MEIYAFGDNSKGELGVLDKRQNLEVLTKIDTLEGTLLDITGDYYGIVLLDSKGNLYSLKQYETMPKQLSVDEKIISVVGAYYSYVALSESGNVWTWGGSNNYGQLGDGTKARRDKPKKITEEGGFESVYSGLYHCFALKPNGDLWGWGYGSLGSLGDGLGQDHTTPTLVLKDIDKVYQGLCSQTFVRMKDGRFMGFGAD
ncbi:regulator of chromosome condensation [Anaeramoeba flamelloides]|uniref:Regulator of chromosome condensation n=1 Tax=Anaeramoeba flamelloides TaxID=1746091 RepID=A0ABQ8YXC0_9EUKA|nr:regulator of chromosome condensation [Anaeramoeba flamelloides]